MAEYRILYWQDIPSVVEAKDGNGTRKVRLSQRFQALIDSVAMRKGLAGTDAYLEAWRRGARAEREGSAEAVAGAIAEELEAQFAAIKAAALEQP
jgi:hypothetical protein